MSDFFNDSNVLETALVKCDTWNGTAWERVFRCSSCCNHAICSDLREQERQKKIKESEAKPIDKTIYFDESHHLFHEFVDTNQIYTASINPVSPLTMSEVLQRWIEYDRAIRFSIED